MGKPALTVKHKMFTSAMQVFRNLKQFNALWHIRNILGHIL